MFGKKQKYDDNQNDYYNDYVDEVNETPEAPAEPVAPIHTEPVEPQKPSISDSIIIKIHSTFGELKELSYQSEQLMDDPAKANIVAYQGINQNILSHIGYIKGLLEILNESHQVSDSLIDFNANQKTISRFTKEFADLNALLAKNDEMIQSVAKTDKKGTATDRSFVDELNSHGYQNLHRDIASRIGYMDALLEILTDPLESEAPFQPNFEM